MSKPLKLELVDTKTVFFSGNTYSYKDMIKAIAGSSWQKKNKRWEAPIESVEDALRILPSIHIASEVKEAYQNLKARHEKALELKDIDESKVSQTVKGLKGKLYPYQAVGKAFLETLHEGEGAILAFDMGLGKSLTSLATALEWKNKGIIDYILVVCPAPLKYATWEKEVRKWTNLEYIVIDGDKSEVVEWDDGTKQRLKGKALREVQYQQYEYGTTVTIMNYELFLYDKELIPNIDSRWCVILDECHRIKNPKASTTKNLRKLLEKAGRKILGSGTPLENNVQELWSTVDFCRKGLLGNYYKFVERYLEVDFFGNPVAPKPQMGEELRRRIAPIMLRKTKEEALPDLPELTIQDYWVEMTPEQKKLYKTVKEGILENASTGEFSYLETLAQLTRLQQVCDSPALLRPVLENPELPIESGKLKELGNIIEDLNPKQNKFILFSQYKEMTDLLYKWLLENNVLPKEQIGYIHGGMKASKTMEYQTAFQEGDMQCILMTTAGNYGLDLSKGTYVICYDELFNPQKMNQIYSRAHRNGAKFNVTAINIRTRDSYEERKAQILEGKKELFKAMIEDDDTAFAKLFSKEELLGLI